MWFPALVAVSLMLMVLISLTWEDPLRPLAGVVPGTLIPDGVRKGLIPVAEVSKVEKVVILLRQLLLQANTPTLSRSHLISQFAETEGVDVRTARRTILRAEELDLIVRVNLEEEPDEQGRHVILPPLCEVCGEPGDIHHENGDRTDNSEVNQRALCRRHHITLENSRFPKRRKRHEIACERTGRPHRHTNTPSEYETEIKTLEERFGLDREIEDVLQGRKMATGTPPGS